MFVEKTRSATLQARGTVQLVTLPRSAFLQALSTHPQLYAAIATHLSQKVRQKTGQVATLLARTGRDATQLVAFFDAKPYERTAFDKRWPQTLHATYFDSRLDLSTVSLARGYPVVCAFVNDQLSAPVIEQLAAFGTQLIALRCAGYNQVDLTAAAAHKLTVVRVPAYSPHAVAEHAVALILALNRNVHRAYNRVREGNFSLNGLVGFDLYGRTAGLIGLGKIGKCLARILRGFGMRVVAYDLEPDPEFARAEQVQFTDLDSLLAQSDIVSLHAPLTPVTHHLLNAKRLGRMKKGALLINTGRGGLIDTSALIEALKSGQIGAAGLDVYEEESAYFFRDRSDKAVDDDVLARLLTFPNVIVTSHQAFLTSDALDNIAQTTIENIQAFLNGATDLPNRVS
ncbi:MAG: 2-hydroxyacid dehydrogenase [Polyangiaceae bacterium]|nr:2-hydroxyacid dehydrogenase [Polyangiaceae bacterium]